MKKYMIKAFTASVTAVTVVISCLLAGVALPVSAEEIGESFALSTTETLYLLSEHGTKPRTYKLGGGTLTYTDGTPKTYTAAELEWEVDDSELATITNGVIQAMGKTGETTLTATVPGVKDVDGNALTATRKLVVVDGSKYVYSSSTYTYGDELMPQGDFETLGKGYWTNEALVEADAGRDSSNGLNLNKKVTVRYKKAISSNFTPGRVYELRFDYKGYKQSKVTMYSDVFNMNNTGPTMTDSDDGQTWKTYTYTFRANVNLFFSEGYDLRFDGAAINSQYPVVVDNLSIKEVFSTKTFTDITLSHTEATIQPGKTLVLKATTQPFDEFANRLQWTSSNPEVAIVNGGCVTAVKAGTTTITVTIGDASASCVVTVPENPSLLKNGTFEDKTDTSWSVSSSAYTAGAGYCKSQAPKIGNGGTLSQTFTGLQPNTTYYLAFYARRGSGQSVQVTVTNGGNTLLDKSSATVNLGYKFIQYTFDTPSQVEEETTLCFTNIKNDYNACFDNVVLFPCVDLTVDAVGWTGDNGKGQVDPGTPITFKAIIKNQGTADVPVGQAFTIDIASNGNVLRTLTYAGGIAAGATVTVTDTEAWTAVAGDHMISARVNASLSVYETNTATNNTHQLNLRVANDRVKPTHEAVADAVEQAGMDRLTMSDDFNSLDTVDMTAGGKEGYKWYVTRYNSQPTLTPHDYRIDHTEDGNGILTLMNEVNAYNITFSSADVNTNNGFLFNKGYLEVKIRIPRPDWYAEDMGSPAIWSFTENEALSGRGDSSHWVELDWMEYYGVSSRFKKGHYTVTVHDTTKNSDYSNSNAQLNGLGDGGWHVMGWLWEDNSIRAFLDGEETMALFFDKDMPAAPGQSPDTSYSVVGSSSDPGIFSPANELASVLYLGGSKDNPMEVDYVRIWQQSEPATVSDNMTLDKTDVTMWERDRERLTVTVPQGEDAGTLTWESSNPSVATVHGNGEVLARSEGTAVITATNANGIAVMCTVRVKHNVIVGGDFEWESDLLYRQLTTKILASSKFSVVSESPDNHCLQIEPDAGAQYYYHLGVVKGATYRFTGRFKNADTMYFYFPSSRVTAVDDLNDDNDSKKSGGRNLSGVDIGDTGWKRFDALITIATGSLNNGDDIFGFANNSTTPLYVDDLVLTRGEDTQQAQYALTVDDVENGSLQLTVDGKEVQSGSLVTPGSKVVVTVKPNEGYYLEPGSLQYSYTHATRSGPKTETRKVLNKDSGDFGEGEGNSFSFVMPSSATTLSAVFEDTGLPVATLGTSVYENENGQFTGVRFLNRLYYTANTSFENNKIFVMYNGKEREVVEFGTLLKRSVNETELTLNSYKQYQNASGDSRIWKTTAYNNQGNTITLVDYTEGYMDFTIVMTSSVANRYSFLSRKYETCAYLILDGGEKVYCETFVDSVLGAQMRR